MAHNVEIVNGVASLAYANEKPWHGLGKNVSSDLTASQMLVEAGLDWNVSLEPTYTRVGDKEVMLDKKALVRDSDGAVLDVVGDNWKPLQNSEAFEFFKDFVDSGKMTMETAGSLQGGKLVWGLAKVGESFEVFGGDKVDAYLLFSNPHKYGKSIDIRFTPIRVVCNNTLDLSLGQQVANSFKQGHAGTFDPELAKATLGIVTEKMGTYKEMAEFLGKRRFMKETLGEYFNEVFPTTGKSQKEVSRNAKRAMEIVETQPGAKFAPGSWWSGFNAVTYMYDHELGRTEDSRFSDSWFGTGRANKVKALEKAIQYAEAA